MVAAALQQSWQAVDTPLGSPRLPDWFASSHRDSSSPTNSDRECAIFDLELHRCISSASLTDPPSVFF